MAMVDEAGCMPCTKAQGGTRDKYLWIHSSLVLFLPPEMVTTEDLIKFRFSIAMTTTIRCTNWSLCICWLSENFVLFTF